MRFSSIIPTMNAGNKLHITLSSLSSQTYRDFECLVIDKLYTDSTKKIVSQYNSLFPHLAFCSTHDNGIYDAMNKGISFATGEYLLFLGAGDQLHNSTVLEQVNLALVAQNPDILYGDILFLPNHPVAQPDKLSNRFFKSGKMICHQSIFAHRKTLTEYPFKQQFIYGADRDWLIHAFRSNKKILHIPLTIADYDTTGVTSLASNRKKIWIESGKILKHHYGFIMIPLTFIKYYLVIKWRK